MQVGDALEGIEDRAHGVAYAARDEEAERRREAGAASPAGSADAYTPPPPKQEPKCEKCGSTLFRKGGKLYCAKEGCGFEMPVPKKD